MKYAVIEASGTQFIVEEGKPIKLDNIDGKKEGDKVEFDHVLLAVDGDKVTLGTPHVAGLTVVGEVAKHFKGEKIRVASFRAKARYRKARGFRHQHTEVVIKSIKGAK
jgi:large subunit ribosomal protein L21